MPFRELVKAPDARSRAVGLIAAIGWPVWLSTEVATDPKPEGHVAVLHRPGCGSVGLLKQYQGSPPMLLRQNRPVPDSTVRDWFRSPTWDPEIAAEFERSLRRARPASRAQYLRIQATHLVEAAAPSLRQAGRELLSRVTAEYPDSVEAKVALEQLGVSLAPDGQFSEAEHALRESVRLCAASPIGKSGTSGTPELRLAEVILASGDSTRVDRLLREVEPDVQRQVLLRDVQYRYLLASPELPTYARIHPVDNSPLTPSPS